MNLRGRWLLIRLISLISLISLWTQALAGPASALPGSAIPPDTLAQRLQPCTACHGAEGRASREGYLPRIAGKPAGYLYHQLLNFRDGRRSNAAMADLLAHQRDDYLREMAIYFAALDLPQAAMPSGNAPPDVMARGETLVRRGDASRQLPACSACHGSTLSGALPAVPGLLGLPRDYLIGQMGAWQTGKRHAIEPDCMADISRRLGAEDTSAVASWLAAQPVAPGWRAGLADPGPKPMPCGSISQPSR